jgi:4-hydroxybenzoyl-CoA reductase alpha subunit
MARIFKETEEYSIIGTNYPKVDGEDKVTGRAKYAGDINIPGMLHCKFLRSPHAHAKILSVDTSKASALPGVMGVITGKDMTGKTMGCVEIDQATADKTPLAIDKVRYIGDELAAVAAIDETTAQRACDLIEVEYELLPAYFTPQEAMFGEVAIHENAAKQFDYMGIDVKEKNVNQYNIVEAGDVDKAFAEADYTDKHVYRTQKISHSAIEPHAAVAKYENGEYTLWSSTQSAYICRYWIARALDVPESRVRVIKPYVGGGFGGKLDVFPHEACCCILAEKTGHPVKMVLTREEVFEATRIRHPITVEIESAFKKDGTLIAKKCKHYLDGGAYGGTGKPANALSIIWENLPYKIPNLRMEAWRVYTNNTVAGAMRGYTSCQIHFACDSHMDEAAHDLGIDPVEFRKMNGVTANWKTATGLKVTSCAFIDTLEAAAERIDWSRQKDRLAQNEGIGFSGSGFLSGTGYAVLTTPTNCSNFTVCRLSRQGYATVYSGANDIGQGLDTVLTVVTAEELGLDLNEIKICVADTNLSPFDTGTLGSRGTFLAGNGARRAAEDAKRQLLETVSLRIGIPVEELECRRHRIYARSDSERGMSFKEAVWAYEEDHDGEGIVGKGHYTHVDTGEEYDGFCKGNYAPSYSFSTGAAKVKVDEETGTVDISDFIFAHDCGRPLNPLAVEGQVEGSVQMGLGYTLFEEVITVSGKVINPSFRDYRFPTALDMPKMQTIFCGEPDPVGPFGAKECGEGSTAPVAPAIANAITHATGIRFDEIPITPERLWRSLKEKNKK